MSPLEQFLPFVTNHPLHRAMGVERIAAAEGQASTEILVGPDLVNPAGMFHGGVVYTVCDMVCFAALLSRLQPGETAATHDIHVSVMKAARLGERVLFTGRVLKHGRTLAFMEAEAHCGDTLLARATVTKSILKMPAS